MIHFASSPLRISLIGGGTDFQSFYEKNSGAVISFTIDKHVYSIVKEKFDNSIKLSYSINEYPSSINKIKHNLIRELFKYYKIKNNIELISIGDIHSKGTGLGSSSAFTLATIAAINSYLNKKPLTKKKLAEESCIIEILKNKSPIGIQDQYASSHGGFNLIKFNKKKIIVKRYLFSKNELTYLNNRLLLFNTGIVRKSNSILEKHEIKIRNNHNVDYLNNLRDETYFLNKKLLKKDFDYIPKSLNKSWELKQKFNSKTKNKKIDSIIMKGMSLGAKGAKLLGAGRGGFVLFYVDKNKKNDFMNKMGLNNFLKYNFTNDGTKIHKIS